MLQIGGWLTGFGLLAMVSWAPMWGLGGVGSADGLFVHFIVIMALLFGVFTTSAARLSFAFAPFSLAIISGAIISWGWHSGAGWCWIAGVLALFASVATSKP